MTRVYARKTKVEAIPLDLASTFVASNHKQGYANAPKGTVSLGLLHGSQLIGVAQFCKPRTERKKREYSVELLRLAFKKGYRVVGGASKLVNHYKKNYRPTDIFTYQDTTGETTNVYEHCGFTLVGQDAKKSYMVAPNKTLETATIGEVWSYGEVVRRGPDALLKTNLGEVFHDNGVRKTNIELFHDLGWRTIETSGDRVYEWFNPSITFYTYKITATDSDKYYYGVSHVKKAFATVEECLNDGYYGSGGVKFQNWKKHHGKHLVKEVLATYSKKGMAYKAEKRLVGDLNKTDPLCLNSTQGGKVYAPPNKYESEKIEKECTQHGMTVFYQGICKKCGVMNRSNLQVCEIHGETKHQGSACYKCIQEKSCKQDNCSIHGLVPFLGDTCQTCTAQGILSKGDCETHGETVFRGGRCQKCVVANRTVIKICEVHGETAFQGDSCYACASDQMVGLQVCIVHGETKFRGGTCYRCYTASRYSVKLCEVHGETQFSGNTCARCDLLARISLKECAVHGEVKHLGSTCLSCKNQSLIASDVCDVHGETKFSGGSCCKCTAAKAARSRMAKQFAALESNQAEILEKIVARVTMAEICREYGVTREALLSFAKENEVSEYLGRRDSVEVIVLKKMPRDEFEKHIVERVYNGPESLNSISAEWGVSRRVVQGLIAKYGIKKQ